MWALRAAVRPGLRLSRVGRGRLVSRAAPPPPGPVRALAATGRYGPGGREGPGSAERRKANGRTTHAGEDEEEPEDEGEEEEEEELLRSDPLLPAGTQRVCLVHPEVKWGAGKPQLTRAEWQVAEARALVHTLAGWSVVDTMVVPTKTPERRLIFGKGNFEHLTERIRGSPEITCVFLNVERLSPPSKKELEAAWGVPVFDRFTVVLHIFRCHARTKEARLQVALAEIPLLRSNLKNDAAVSDRSGGGSRYIMGSGESFLQLRQRLLREKEVKLRRALERLRRKRQHLRRQRAKREFPVVAVVGYTNCGKTTLIRALTSDEAAQPRDQLFATLDITAHAGSLPSRMTVLYMDTIGFLSQLPHGLIESFSATLEDVAHAQPCPGGQGPPHCHLPRRGALESLLAAHRQDVIVHVRDVSHPETELQKVSVLSALQGLGLPAPLLDSVVEVHNKVDLVPGYRPQTRAQWQCPPSGDRGWRSCGWGWRRPC
ncbi:putative GTP-binding protein 6 isoform X3 [Ictidomys tridecemlineatus]